MSRKIGKKAAQELVIKYSNFVFSLINPSTKALKFRVLPNGMLRARGASSRRDSNITKSLKAGGMSLQKAYDHINDCDSFLKKTGCDWRQLYTKAYDDLRSSSDVSHLFSYSTISQLVGQLKKVLETATAKLRKQDELGDCNELSDRFEKAASVPKSTCKAVARPSARLEALAFSHRLSFFNSKSPEGREEFIKGFTADEKFSLFSGECSPR